MTTLTFLYGCDSGSAKLYPFNNQYYKYGYMNGNGEVIIEPQFDWTKSFSEGLAATRKDGKWGFIDKSGKEVIPLKYDNVWTFDESGIVVVKFGGRIGLMTDKGKFIGFNQEDIYKEELLISNRKKEEEKKRKKDERIRDKKIGIQIFKHLNN